MKREIKFRAWNDEKMIYPTSLTNGQIIDRFENVMQFIGCKDAAGKDIYEGDIIEIESFYDETITYKYQIDFKNENCSFVGIGYPGEWLNSDELDGCIVIGNIHENPELL